MEARLVGGWARILMKILSWNVRGLGSRVKRKRVRETVIKAAPDVVLLQETKLEVLDDLVVRDL